MSNHDERDDYDDDPARGRVTTEQLVRRTASVLWTFGLLQMGVPLVAVLGMTAAVLVSVASGHPPKRVDVGEAAGLFGLAVGGVVVSAAMLYGSYQMRRFRRYPWAVAAALLTVSSLPCVYFGVVTVPFGVWALILLARRDVRDRFAAETSGRYPT